MKPALTLAVLLLLTACSMQDVRAALKTYQVDYHVTFRPDRGIASVVINWGQGAERITQMELRTHQRMSNFKSNTGFKRDGQYLLLGSVKQGMQLSYDVTINNVRSDGEYDARMTADWAIWRGDDLIPPGRVTQKKNTEADAHLTLSGPEGWSFKTPYRELKDGRFSIRNPQRSFDRPTGWMIGGEIGVRTEKIAGVSIAVAGPLQQDVRRMDILAFLNWTLPSLSKVLPRMPDRLLLVSAKDGMWRGGLSAGNSLYLHADRPLISGNGTSTVLHELVHVASGLDSVQGGDWIVEGLAEYYSVKLLHRSGTITDSRRKRAMASLSEWSAEAGPLDALHSSGPTTAKAVLIMQALDLEIEKNTGGKYSLDDVLRALVDDHDVSIERLRAAQLALTGMPSKVLDF